MAMSKAPTSPFHWSVGVWHVLLKPLPKVEIASTWELGISSSSSDGKCHELAFFTFFLPNFLNTYEHYPSDSILSSSPHSF